MQGRVLSVRRKGEVRLKKNDVGLIIIAIKTRNGRMCCTLYLVKHHNMINEWGAINGFAQLDFKHSTGRFTCI